jgi:hypothetical protein
MLLAIEIRGSGGEVAAAMSVAEVCGLCKDAFATEPGLCAECAETLDRWLSGDEGLAAKTDRPIRSAWSSGARLCNLNIRGEQAR